MGTWHTPLVNRRYLGISVAAAFVVGMCACAQLSERDKNREQAKTTGKYKVRLTDDVESVQGTCKFVQSIVPDMDPIQSPTKAQLEDYYRVEGVLLGADTVLVRGRTTGSYRTGEAYLCGPTPLNPDGSPREPYAAITPGAR